MPVSCLTDLRAIFHRELDSQSCRQKSGTTNSYSSADLPNMALPAEPAAKRAKLDDQRLSDELTEAKSDYQKIREELQRAYAADSRDEGRIQFLTTTLNHAQSRIQAILASQSGQSEALRDLNSKFATQGAKCLVLAKFRALGFGACGGLVFRCLLVCLFGV